MILVLLGNHYAGYRGKLRQFHNKMKNIERLRPVLDFIDEHLSERIAVNGAASVVHMSKSCFIHFFKKVTGQPFVAYLNHLRVARAEWLLSATDIPLADLCQQAGFCDQSYFGTVFRKSVGMTPTQYRRKFSGAPGAGPDYQTWPDGWRTSFTAHSGLIPEELTPEAKLEHSGSMPMKPGELIQ
jgi:AraC-like DNA-binding protein